MGQPVRPLVQLAYVVTSPEPTITTAGRSGWAAARAPRWGAGVRAGLHGGRIVGRRSDPTPGPPGEGAGDAWEAGWVTYVLGEVAVVGTGVREDVDGPDIHLGTPGFYLRPDYHEVLAWLRRHAPVFPTADGMVALSRYEEVRDVSRDPGGSCPDGVC